MSPVQYVIPQVVCARGQSVFARAAEAFGRNAVVCVAASAGDRRVVGKVAKTWRGPFYDVVRAPPEEVFS